MSVLINGMVFEVYGTGGVGMVWGKKVNISGDVVVGLVDQLEGCSWWGG